MKDNVKKSTILGLTQHPIGDLAPKTMRNIPYKKRERKKNEALPPENDLFRRPNYRVGDGEIVQLNRPGSSDFLKWPSKGLSA
jgi:hypothetical protein